MIHAACDILSDTSTFLDGRSFLGRMQWVRLLLANTRDTLSEMFGILEWPGFFLSFKRGLTGKRVALWFVAALALPACAQAQERPPLITAMLIYNAFPDSSHRLAIAVGPDAAAAKTIQLPAWLLDLPLTRAEAGALVSAIGAYVTPDVRRKPRVRLDRADRLVRLLRAMESCPGALASAGAKLRNVEPGGAFDALMHYVRTERVEFARAPDPNCAVD